MKIALALASLLACAAASPVEYAPLSQEMVDHINSLDATWTAGHNEHFRDVPIEVLKAMMGTLPEPEELKLPLKLVEDVADEDIPAAFDSRKNWPHCATIREIRDQGACGSCWAFGAVEAMSDRICIHSAQKQHFHVSAEDLLACCGLTCGFGCEGGFPSAAWRYFENTGLVSGGLYHSHKGCQPYEIASCDHHVHGHLKPCGRVVPTPACSHQCESSFNGTFNGNKRFGTSAYSVGTTVAAIQKEIMTNGPVEAAFTVYADFPSYKGGVYEHKHGAALGGHAVKIIGWGVLKNVDYWLVANSWNTDWGLKGYFLIERGVDMCGIESQCTAGLPRE